MDYVARMKGYLSVDVDVSSLVVNQCDAVVPMQEPISVKQIAVFRGSHKCHNETTQVTNILKNQYCILNVS